MTVNIKDIDSSLSELSIATRDHYHWANKCLRLSLLCGEPDKEINDRYSHQHCRFSRWLGQLLQGASLDRELVLLIDKHHTARELILSIITRQVSEELLNYYNEAQQKFIFSVDRYKKYLYSYRNLYDALTGLPLRHLMYQEFPLIRSRCERAERSLSADDSLHSAIGRADKAMYYGKNTGRNRCILALSDAEMVTLE